MKPVHGAIARAWPGYLVSSLLTASLVLSAKVEQDPIVQLQQTLPDYNIEDLDLGSYNNCGKREPMMWMLLGGGLRSMPKHLSHTKDFLSKSTSCYFVAMILRSTVTGPTLGNGMGDAPLTSSGNEIHMQAEKVSKLLQTNVAFAIAHRNFQSPSGEGMIDTWHASHKLLKLASKIHQIRRSDQDIVFLSRPDIVYSHAVQFGRLHTLAKTGRKFTLIMRHERGQTGGCDPTEVWAITSLGVWDATMNLCNAHTALVATSIKDHPNASTITAGSYSPPSGLPPPGMTRVWQPCPGYTAFKTGCGHGYRRILAEVTASIGADVYHVSPTMKAHFHRMSGDFFTAVNRPGDSSISMQTVKPAIDVTQGVICELTSPASCSPDAPEVGPKSREGATTRLAHFRCGPQHGKGYICDSSTNLLQPEDSDRGAPNAVHFFEPRQAKSYKMAPSDDPDDTMEEYYVKHWYNGSAVGSS